MKIKQTVIIGSKDVSQAVKGWVVLGAKLVSSSGKPNYSMTAKMSIYIHELEHIYGFSPFTEGAEVTILYRKEGGEPFYQSYFTIDKVGISSSTVGEFDIVNYDLILAQNTTEREENIPEWLLDASQHMYLPWNIDIATSIKPRVMLPRTYQTILGLPEKPHTYGLTDSLGWLGSRTSDARRWKTDGVTLGSLNFYENDLMRYETDGTPKYTNIEGSNDYYLGTRLYSSSEMGDVYKTLWAVENDNNIYTLASPRFDEMVFPTDYEEISQGMLFDFGSKATLETSEVDTITPVITEGIGILPLTNVDKVDIPSASCYAGRRGVDDDGDPIKGAKYITHIQAIGTPFLPVESDEFEWEMLKMTDTTGTTYRSSVRQMRERQWFVDEANRNSLVEFVTDDDTFDTWYDFYDLTPPYVYTKVANDFNLLVSDSSIISYRYLDDTEEQNESGNRTPEVHLYKIGKIDYVKNIVGGDWDGSDWATSEPNATIQPEYIGTLPQKVEPGRYIALAFSSEIYTGEKSSPLDDASDEPYNGYFNDKENRVSQFVLTIETLQRRDKKQQCISTKTDELLSVFSKTNVNDFYYLTQDYSSDSNWTSIYSNTLNKIDLTTKLRTKVEDVLDGAALEEQLRYYNPYITSTDTLLAVTYQGASYNIYDVNNKSRWTSPSGVAIGDEEMVLKLFAKGLTPDWDFDSSKRIVIDANVFPKNDSENHYYNTRSEYTQRLLQKGESQFRMNGVAITNSGNVYVASQRKLTNNKLLNNEVVEITWVNKIGDKNYSNTYHVFGDSYAADIKYGLVVLSGDVSTNLSNEDSIRLYVPPIRRQTGLEIPYTAIAYPVKHKILSLNYDEEKNLSYIYIDPSPNHHGTLLDDYGDYEADSTKLAHLYYMHPDTGDLTIAPWFASESYIRSRDTEESRLWHDWTSGEFNRDELAQYQEVNPQVWKCLEDTTWRSELWFIGADTIASLDAGYKGSIRSDAKYVAELLEVATQKETLNSQKVDFATEYGTFALPLTECLYSLKDTITVYDEDSLEFVPFKVIEEDLGVTILTTKEYSNLTITFTKYSSEEYFPIANSELGDIVFYQGGRFYTTPILPTKEVIEGRYVWQESLVELLDGEQIGGSASGKVIYDAYLNDDGEIYLPILHGDTVRMIQPTDKCPVASPVKFKEENNQDKILPIAADFGFIRPNLLQRDDTTSFLKSITSDTKLDTCIIPAEQIVSKKVETLWTTPVTGMFVTYGKDNKKYPNPDHTDEATIQAIVKSGDPIAVSSKNIVNIQDAYHRWCYERLMVHNELPQLVIHIALKNNIFVDYLDNLGQLYIIETDLPSTIACKRVQIGSLKKASLYGILKESKVTAENQTAMLKFNLIPETITL